VTDAQSGHEKTLTGLLPALAGANLIYGLGMLESGVTMDYGQLVLDNEIARLIKYSVGGIPVNDETLAVEDIAQVGAFGDFLSLDATYKHMREQSMPRLMDRRVREDWAAAGATSLYDRAVVEARRILESHRPDQLPDDVQAEMTEIVAQAERDLGVGRDPG
jgi:trimethylamine--corrinoid protein Co-methyltransferase